MPKFGSPLGYAVSRRSASSGFVQLTPGETNEALHPLTDRGPDDVPVTGPGILEERLQQSEVPCRPSRFSIAFFLSPWGYAWSDDFLMGHESIPRMPNTPQGRLSQQDERRNIAIPPRISYGALVGENDGVSPYGLE